MSRWLALAMGVVIMGGCASGFDRALLRHELSEQPYRVTDCGVRRAMSIKPQLRLPMRVAVYMVAEGEWRWSVEDKRQVESWAESLKQRGMVRDIFVMPDMIVRGKDVRGVRAAAARCGADAVLLIHGATQVDEYFNPLCLANVLILPMWFLPSAHSDALVMLQGTLYDVGNECIYVGVEAEAEGSICRPVVFAENEHAINKGKAKALADFGRQFEERLASLCWNLRASAAAPDPEPARVVVEPLERAYGRRYETR